MLRLPSLRQARSVPRRPLKRSREYPRTLLTGSHKRTFPTFELRGSSYVVLSASVGLAKLPRLTLWTSAFTSASLPEFFGHRVSLRAAITRCRSDDWSFTSSEVWVRVRLLIRKAVSSTIANLPVFTAGKVVSRGVVQTQAGSLDTNWKFALNASTRRSAKRLPQMFTSDGTWPR